MNIYLAYPRKDAKKWEPFIDGELLDLLPETDTVHVNSTVPEETLWNCDFVVFFSHGLGDKLYNLERSEATRLAMTRTHLDGRTAQELARDLARRPSESDLLRDRAKRQRAAVCNALRDTKPIQRKDYAKCIAAEAEQLFCDDNPLRDKLRGLLDIANLAVSAVVELRKEALA